MPNPTVYLIEDDDGSRFSTEYLLNLYGLQTKSFVSGEEFFTSEVETPFGCIVTDLVLPDMTGIDLYRKTRELGWWIPSVVITAHGDVSSAAVAFQSGICDFFEKPVFPETLISSVQRCFEFSCRTLKLENDKKDALNQLNRLTKTEQRVLRSLVWGESMTKIALKFGVSFQAVAIHRQRIFTKLDKSGDVLLLHWIRKYNLEPELALSD